MINALLAKIHRQHLFAPAETVVVAVSGGADSVALLDILVSLESEQLKLVVAHLNHCLRGADSDGDEAFVARLAAAYHLPCVTKRVDVAAFAKESRLSLEDAGRKARYAFFDETAKACGATSIAIAHHLDDQAETVLIRLLRGAGGDGLSAMACCRGIVKRPLLQVCRAELEQYLSLRGLSWRTDATNADTAILRNRIRHELIPELRSYNPKVAERLAATAQLLTADQELLAQLTESAYSRVITDIPSPPGIGAGVRAVSPGTISLNIDSLLNESPPLRLRLYRRALTDLRGDLQRIVLRHLEAIDALIVAERPNARVKLPGDCFVSRSYNLLTFGRTAERATAPWEIEIEGEGSHLLPTGQRILVQRVSRPAELASSSSRLAYLQPQLAPFPWTIRSFRPGDRFRPLGMHGTQKVKEFFINNKVPPGERLRVPLLESAGRIVWVAGMRLAEEVRLTATGDELLRVEILEP